MTYRFEDILHTIDEDDLYNIQKDLADGGIILKQIIDARVKQLENKKRSICATCGETIQTKEHTYTLVFGPEDFKKKASFCEIDCLEYFLAGLRKLSERIQEEEEEDMHEV